MKAQILKIAKVKSEKEFYKKYPSEEAFMKVHGKAFKKAQFGTYIGGDTNAAPAMIDYNSMYKAADRGVTGMDDDMRQAQADRAAAQAASQAASKGGESGGGMGDIMGMLGGAGEGEDGGGGIMSMLGGEGGGEGLMSMLGGARYGTDIPKAQYGYNPYNTTMSSQQTAGQPITSGGSLNVGGGSAVNISGGGTPFGNSGDQHFDPKNIGTPGKGMGGLEKFGKYLGPLGDVIGGLGELEQEREALKVAKRDEQLSGLQLRASQTRPEMKERKYVRPEDVRNTGEEFFPIYGVGTNVLARSGARLQGGGMIGGNPTEIQNTYSNGYDIYTDGGYEPLQDPNQVKDFRHGGYLHTMEDGGSAGGGTPWGAISSQVTGMGQSLMPGGRNAGGGIGSTVGSTLGTAFGGPIGGAIGGFVGGMAGNLLDTNTKNTQLAQESTKRNTQNIAMNQMAPAIQAGYASHLQNGGYMNPNYNPQLITMFGDHNSDDFADYANKFRAGGHLKEYTAPSERAMETYKNGGQMSSYAMGGELQTHWGGEAETMSYNPYMPGSGETVVFRGQSHNESDREGNTGIGITYGDNPVEVERGEPMIQMQAGGNVDPETGEPEVTGVVFGNMEINKKVAAQFNDEELMPIASKYHGKKFKNVGIDLSKQEAKQNKIIDKSSNELSSLEVNTPFDKLKLSSLRANIEGANLKLKGIADTKITLANYQNAINDTKEEMSDAFGQNISAEHLAKGLIKLDKDPVTMNAEWGGNISKLQNGGGAKKITKKERDAYIAKGYKPDPKDPSRLIRVKEAVTTTTPETTKIIPGVKGTGASANTSDARPGGKAGEPWRRKMIAELNRGVTYEELAKKGHGTLDGLKKMFPGQYRPLPGTPDIPERIERIPGTSVTTPGSTEEVSVENDGGGGGGETPRFPWEVPVNALIDYFRPTDQSPLDYNQLMGEMYALSSNQLDPVQAQMYKPELGIPYDISYQDLLNENQADYNSAQRMAGYNPAAQANLNAQKYQANSKVLAEQFRANQAMKDKVYGENRQTLNQAKLANLGMLDKQYERQSQAMSNTKATTQAALSSMSDKYAKNKLENRKLSIYENMYNYRFGKSGRARNFNGLQFFDTNVDGAQSRQKQEIPPGYKAISWDENGNPTRLQSITEKDMKEDIDEIESIGTKKNGGSTKKNYKNSSVVKAYKNL
jgi:hypothetical protein